MQIRNSTAEFSVTEDSSVTAASDKNYHAKYYKLTAFILWLLVRTSSAIQNSKVNSLWYKELANLNSELLRPVDNIFTFV